jgi:hypothetical protein
MEDLAVPTLQEALCGERLEDRVRGSSSAAHHVTRRRSVPSRESLLFRTREYLLPPQLLPGPFSILIG